MKEKQNWASEGPKLENARRLRGIFFIDPEGKDFKEIIKNAQEKLKVPAAPAMPCKRANSKHGATRSKNDDHRSKLACILEADESKTLRMEGAAPRIQELRLAELCGSNYTSWQSKSRTAGVDKYGGVVTMRSDEIRSRVLSGLLFADRCSKLVHL